MKKETHVLRIFIAFCVAFILFPALVDAYVEGFPLCDDCKEKKCYILRGNTKPELLGLGLPEIFKPFNDLTVDFAKKDCEAAGLKPVVIDPADFDDFKMAIQDPCAAEYVMIGHGSAGSVEASDGKTVDRWVIMGWLNASFWALGGPVHPCAKKIIVHGCSTNSDSWAELFGVDKEHVFTWGIPILPNWVTFWQFFHSQDKNDLNLAPMPENEQGCRMITDPEEADETIERTFKPYVKYLKEGTTNLFASRGRQRIFLVSVTKENDEISGVSLNQLEYPEYVSTISSDTLFELIGQPGNQFEDTCGNGEIDRNEHCDYGFPCPEPMMCTSTCICAYPEWGDDPLPPQEPEEESTVMIIDKDPMAKSFFERIFYFIRSFFSLLDENSLLDEKEASESSDEDPCDCTEYGQDIEGAEYCQNTFGPTTPNGYVNYCQCHGEKCTCTYCDESANENSYVGDINGEPEEVIKDPVVENQYPERGDHTLPAQQNAENEEAALNLPSIDLVIAKSCGGAVTFYGTLDQGAYNVKRVTIQAGELNKPKGYINYDYDENGIVEASATFTDTEQEYEVYAITDDNALIKIDGGRFMPDTATCEEPASDIATFEASHNLMQSDNLIEITGTLQGDIGNVDTMTWIAVRGIITDEFPVQIDGNSFNVREVFFPGSYTYTLDLKTHTGEHYILGQGTFSIESSCPYYDNSDCDENCVPSARCDPEPDSPGCYFCNSVCGGGEYYNDEHCGGLCTEGVNECVQTSDVPCWACLSE